MDYSLLVGIHDCLQPVTDSDLESDGDMDDYMSGEGEDNPTTPTSLTSGDQYNKAWSSLTCE